MLNILNSYLLPPCLYFSMFLYRLDGLIVKSSRDMTHVLLHFSPLTRGRDAVTQSPPETHSPRVLLCLAAARCPVQGRQTFLSQPNVHIYPKPHCLVIFQVICKRQMERKTFRCTAGWASIHPFIPQHYSDSMPSRHRRTAGYKGDKTEALLRGASILIGTGVTSM